MQENSKPIRVAGREVQPCLNLLVINPLNFGSCYPKTSLHLLQHFCSRMLKVQRQKSFHGYRNLVDYKQVLNKNSSILSRLLFLGQGEIVPSESIRNNSMRQKQKYVLCHYYRLCPGPGFSYFGGNLLCCNQGAYRCTFFFCLCWKKSFAVGFLGSLSSPFASLLVFFLLLGHLVWLQQVQLVKQFPSHRNQCTEIEDAQCLFHVQDHITELTESHSPCVLSIGILAVSAFVLFIKSFTKAYE